MPYFLVTHTSMVEADNETAAATQVGTKIAASQTLTFDVKSDEQRSKRITVSARALEKADNHELTRKVLRNSNTARVASSEGAMEGSNRPTSTPRLETKQRCRGCICCVAAIGVAVLISLSVLVLKFN
jgi:hypothetical protein